MEDVLKDQIKIILWILMVKWSGGFVCEIWASAKVLKKIAYLSKPVFLVDPSAWGRWKCSKMFENVRKNKVKNDKNCTMVYQFQVRFLLWDLP